MHSEAVQRCQQDVHHDDVREPSSTYVPCMAGQVGLRCWWRVQVHDAFWAPAGGCQVPCVMWPVSSQWAAWIPACSQMLHMQDGRPY